MLTYARMFKLAMLSIVSLFSLETFATTTTMCSITVGVCPSIPKYNGKKFTDTDQNANKNKSKCLARAQYYYDSCRKTADITADYNQKKGKKITTLGKKELRGVWTPQLTTVPPPANSSCSCKVTLNKNSIGWELSLDSFMVLNSNEKYYADNATAFQDCNKAKSDICGKNPPMGARPADSCACKLTTAKASKTAAYVPSFELWSGSTVLEYKGLNDTAYGSSTYFASDAEALRNCMQDKALYCGPTVLSEGASSDCICSLNSQIAWRLTQGGVLLSSSEPNGYQSKTYTSPLGSFGDCTIEKQSICGIGNSQPSSNCTCRATNTSGRLGWQIWSDNNLITSNSGNDIYSDSSSALMKCNQQKAIICN